jgi:hypothetical protein
MRSLTMLLLAATALTSPQRTFAKSMNDAGADAALTYWTDATAMNACSAEPTTYAEANATYRLGTVAPTFQAIANGDTSGRKRAIDAKTGISVLTGGTVTHMALIKAGDTTLRYVTTTASQAISGGGTYDQGAWKIELADPS